MKINKFRSTTYQEQSVKDLQDIISGRISDKVNEVITDLMSDPDYISVLGNRIIGVADLNGRDISFEVSVKLSEALGHDNIVLEE